MSTRDYFIGDRKFYKTALAIAIPLAIQEIITNIVSLLDNVMVGRLGTLEMSAVAIINQLFFIVNLSIFGALSAAGLFAAQYVGAKNENGIRHCFRIKVIMGLLILLLTFLVLGLFPSQLINLYIADDTLPADAAATIGYGLKYVYIMLIGYIPFTVSRIYGMSLRETGEARMPMISSLIAIATNLLLNYILIFGKLGFTALGVAGAAIATVISRFVEAILLVVYTHASSDRFAFIKNVYKSLSAPKPLWRDVIRKGVPLLANEFLWSLGIACYLQAYSSRGLEVVAAANIASTLNSIFNTTSIAMGITISVLVGQRLGANDREGAKMTAWRLIALGFCFCILLGLILASLSGVIPKMYKVEPEVKELASHFLIAIAVSLPFQLFSNGCYFTLRSGGKTLITFFLDSGFMWLISVPIAYTLSNYTAISITAIYLIVQNLDAIKSVIGTVLIRRGKWISNIIEEKE
ncbi:MAG: MATE family efflux transporter [Clostridia bacterium]|nr:MATE family efflux transporter [Clostridia bacterium]